MKENIDISVELPYPIKSKVFIVSDKNEIKEREIRSYRLEVGPGRDGYASFAMDITTYQYVFFGPYFCEEQKDYDYIPLDRVFGTKEEAERVAKFREVSLDEYVWLNAIGRRDKITKNPDGNIRMEKEEEWPIDESELGSCCAAISSVRDILCKAKEKNGLIQKDIDSLVNEFGACPVDMEEAPNLKKIFDALGIKEESYV